MKSEPRKDAIAKIKGRCRFTDDYCLKGMLSGYVLYSKIDKGKIRKIIYPAGYELSEFIIVTWKDIPGENIVPEPVCDQPFLVEEHIEHYGQIILAAAHSDKSILHKFLAGVRVEYEEEEALIDVQQCLDDKANKFGDNMHISNCIKEKERPENLKHVHDVFYTQHQEQAYLEPQGMLAEYNAEDSKIKIIGTMQCPYFVKEAVQRILGKAVDHVEIETSEGIGGAFGGKEDFPNLLAGITALLAYVSQRPVKIVLDRSDDLLITTKRHPSRIEIDSYTNQQTGQIEAMNIDFRLDAGAYQTLSPVVLHRGILHAGGGYVIPRCEIVGYLHKSNTPSNGAFRGFGAPQALFGIESHLDNIGKLIGKSPSEMRKINLLRSGDRMPSSQIIKEDHLNDCLQRVLEISDYEKKKDDFIRYNQSHLDKKGIGIVLALHGGGYTGNGEKLLKSKVKLRIESDGMIRIFVANVEMGQGAHTTLAEMVSREFKLPLSRVNVEIPNTSRTPNSGPTVASRTIYIVGNLLLKLVRRIKREYGITELDEFIEQNQQRFPLEEYEVFVADKKDIFDDKTNCGVAYHDFSWAAGVVEISYDDLEYKIKVDEIWNVLDIGRVINYDIALGQVYGGITQALGWALTEDVYKRGFPRIRGFTDYVLPACDDTPKINVEFIHTDSVVAKGLGEIPMDYPAAAVRNAFLQATGIMINELPLTPEKIYQAVQRSKI